MPALLSYACLRVCFIVFVLGKAAPPIIPSDFVIDNFTTTNIFWPDERAADGTLFTCTFIPTLVLANGSRLVAHGMCYTVPHVCPGLHLQHAGLNPSQHSEHIRLKHPLAAGICQKHSDDGGRTWSTIKLIISSRNGEITLGMLVWDNRQKAILLQYPLKGHGIFQVKSIDLGDTWSDPRDISPFLAPLFTPPSYYSNVGPGAGLQLSASNRFHPHRLIFVGWYGKPPISVYDAIWYSDDGGDTYSLARGSDGQPAKLMGLTEAALAETPGGGVVMTARNSIYHGARKCNCRAMARSSDGGSTFGEVTSAPVLVEPICQGTMLNSGGLIFHVNPGHGTPDEDKSPPNGRASGTVRRSSDGGRTWDASVVLNGHAAFSYSCLSHVPQSAMIGLAWETVLPSYRNASRYASANNILFTLIPVNFSSGDSRLAIDQMLMI